MAPPDRDDHLHVDPIALTCAVLDRARTFRVMLTLNKIGLDMPAGHVKVWENKMKSSRQSEMQLENGIKSLDPADRDDAREFVKAVENTLTDLATQRLVRAVLRLTIKKPANADDPGEDGFLRKGY